MATTAKLEKLEDAARNKHFDLKALNESRGFDHVLTYMTSQKRVFDRALKDFDSNDQAMYRAQGAMLIIDGFFRLFDNAEQAYEDRKKKNIQQR